MADMRIWIAIGILGLILFLPVYLIKPTFTLDSITAYYLAGFIFVEVSLFLWSKGLKIDGGSLAGFKITMKS